MSKIKKSNKSNAIQKSLFQNTFSIVIANYNYAAHVNHAIRSSLEQNYPISAFEVIVVDDGSTDNSRQVISSIASENHQNLRVITQQNLGQAAAFFAGINAAQYEWICLLDADDYFMPEKLSVLNNYILKQTQNFDFICHNVNAVDENTGFQHDWFGRKNVIGDDLLIDAAKGAYPFANPCGQVYKKSLLQKLAPWLNLSDWKRGADNPLAWGALMLNGRVCYIHEKLAVYRIHANNFFLAATSKGLLPKVNWLDRWPKMLEFLSYLHQGSLAQYSEVDSREKLLSRLRQFFEYWQKRLNHQPDKPFISFITTCKNRLHHLKQTLPLMLKQTNTEVIVVDYGCKQGTRDWVKSNFPQVKVVEVDDDEGWSVARARNLGAAQAKAELLCFIDADVLLNGDLAKWAAFNIVQGYMYQADPILSPSLKGTVICHRQAFIKVGGYDEAYRGWFPEDGDFYATLEENGVLRGGFPAAYLNLIEHGDEERALGRDDQMNTREQAMQAGMLYRTAKKDITQLTGVALELGARRMLLDGVMKKLKKMHDSGKHRDGQIVLPVNQGLIPYQYLNFDRYLVYSPRNVRHLFKTQVDALMTKQNAASKIKEESASQKSHSQRVAMFHIGRSGSSVLADMINQHPDMHWEGEIYETVTKAITQRLGYFNYGSPECRYDPLRVLEQRLTKYQNQPYGFEVKFNQLEHCGLALGDYLKKIRQLGVDKMIVLRRENILRKIVSSLVAEETKVWHVGAGKEAPKKKITINPETITVERKTGSLISILDHYTKNLEELDTLLVGVDALSLSYEEDIEHDPLKGYNKVAEYLGFTAFTRVLP